MKFNALTAFLLIVFSAALLGADEEFVFPHQLHVEDEGLECGDCHSQVESSVLAADNLNPEQEICLDCHDPDDLPESWPAPERDFFFSHQYHLQNLSLECSACHGDIGQMEQILPEAMPTMDDCMACHSGMAAPRDCALCHSQDRAQLTPLTHQPGWQRGHGRSARITDSSCVPCHAVSDCQECHEGGMLLELAELPGSLQAPFGTELEGAQGLSLKRVHGLNYRFVHALEARGKSSNCISCHELNTGDFCATCHNPALNPDLRPTWHGGGDWGALAGGVGTGGGRHGQLARRDMENCVACHDMQGEDPSCLLCHMDRKRGKGNDPRTHSTSFAGDIGTGDFHDDDGAVCYTCHLYKGRTGSDGFCGYCHGSK
ncbi:MAG: cytochrome c3 family protein [Gemmatimonadetes bacterium]|jgi:c(7)-type cytochrome triheme protein|nr:cytochrome c3 family protein [Gemmatimonadota bacterium]